jgi:N-acyl homoserine lactone hydrolase
MAAKMKVHILHCGGLSGDLTWLLLKPGRTVASRSNPTMPAPWTVAPTLAVLVEHPEGRLLFDNSCPRDWEERWAPSGLNEFLPYDAVSEHEYFDSRLHQLGLGPEDIDMNVISHLHFDHAANTKMLADAGCRIVTSDVEKDDALSFDAYSMGAYIKSDYEGVMIETIKGDEEIWSGVKVLQTPGHTAGCISLQVDLEESGTMIFTSDAVYLSESYGPPAIGAALVWDNREWLRSVEKIREIARHTNATVIFGHDLEQYKTLRLAPDGYYT